MATGNEAPIVLPDGARMLGLYWPADGERLALTLKRDEEGRHGRYPRNSIFPNEPIGWSRVSEAY